MDEDDWNVGCAENCAVGFEVWRKEGWKFCWKEGWQLGCDVGWDVGTRKELLKAKQLAVKFAKEMEKYL